MMTIFINDDILQDKVSIFFNFAKSISDSFTLSREFNGKLPKDIFNRLNNELKAEINKEDSARREKYKKDEKYARELKQIFGIATKKQALKYFDDIKKDDLKAVTASRTLGDDKPFEAASDDHLETFYSKQSAVRRGPVFEILRFNTEGDTFRKVTVGLKDVYDSSMTYGEVRYADIAFYKDGEFKIGLNCADRYCLMRLEKEELNEFVNLKITSELS